MSLACVGCARLPSDMGDGREKHPVCPKCVTLKLPTTYFCGRNCPGNPLAWKTHAAYHKEVQKQWKREADGGATQQRHCETAEKQAREAVLSGDEYMKLVAEGIGYISKRDYRRAARTIREAISLRTDEPGAYHNLGAALANSGHDVEAAQRYLEAMERVPVDLEFWALATARAFDLLKTEECDEVVKPEWWNDEALEALSTRVLRAAPNEALAIDMRAMVLSVLCDGAWEAGPRSAAELKEAAALFDRSAALCNSPSTLTSWRADKCRRWAEGLERAPVCLSAPFSCICEACYTHRHM